MRIFHLPIFAQRLFGKVGDVFLRLGHGPAQGIVGLEGSRQQFGTGDGELAGRKFRAVEFLSEFQERVVAAGEDSLHDIAGLPLNFFVEKAAGGGDLANLGGKILVSITDDFHTTAYKKPTGKSKRAVTRGKIPNNNDDLIANPP